MSKIIVSLTSYPKRISVLPNVIASLNNQTVKPDKIVIYLTKEEFAGHKNLVDEKYFAENNAVICWVNHNYGPYNKFIYAFKEFKDDIIITVDDDFEYTETMIEELVMGATKFPDAIIARRVRVITSTDDDELEDYENWYAVQKEEMGLFADSPRFDLIALGVGGVLYHPNQFSDELLREDLFSEISPGNDDLWLKLYQMLAGIPVVQVVARINEDYEIKEMSRDGLYANRNKTGDNQIFINNIICFCEKKGITLKQIVNSIFIKEHIYKSEVENLISVYLYGDNSRSINKNFANNELTLEQIIGLIKRNKHIYIYGSGFYGKRLLRLILDLDLCKSVFFIETKSETIKEDGGISILPVEALVKVTLEDSAVILAGSRRNSYSMANELEKIGISYYYFLNEMAREYLKNIDGMKH